MSYTTFFRSSNAIRKLIPILVSAIFLLVILSIALVFFRPTLSAELSLDEEVDKRKAIDFAEKKQEEQRDSVVLSLLDMVTPHPSTDLNVIKWFQDKKNWEPFFGDLTSLDRAVVSKAEYLIESRKLEQATRLLLALGRITGEEKDWPRTAARSQWALSLATESMNRNDLGWAFMQIGVTYAVILDSTRALFNLEKAIALAEETKDKELEILSKANLGANCFIKGQYEQAESFCREAFESVDYDRLPQVYLYTLRLYSLALTYNDKCEQGAELINNFFNKHGKPKEVAHAYILLVLYYCHLTDGRYSQAEQVIQEICDIGDRLNHDGVQETCAKESPRLYVGWGKTDVAISMYQDLTDDEKLFPSSETFESVRLAEQNQQERQLKLRIDIERRARQAELEQEQYWYGTVEKAVLSLAVILLLVLLGLLSRQKILKERQRKETAEVKLLALRAQMNPHFMFNAINGIQNQILTAKKMEAYGYLGKFADLLRTITNNSDSTSITLQQEIRFLKTYLELEKLRFRTGFNFTFTGVEELPDLNKRIPAMMIQPFVENAIIHGLSILNYPGKLEMIFEPLSWGMRCIVQDNGRGRAAGRERTADEPSNHLSITYRNTEARILSLRESGYSRADIEVYDLVEKGQAKGTKVVLYLPFLPINVTALADDDE